MVQRWRRLRAGSGAISPIAYRVAVAVALAAAFPLVGLNFAVGTIGSEDNPADLIYFEALPVAAREQTPAAAPWVDARRRLPPDPEGHRNLVRYSAGRRPPFSAHDFYSPLEKRSPEKWVSIAGVCVRSVNVVRRRSM